MVLILLVITSSWASDMPHLDLEMTSQEIQRILEQTPSKKLRYQAVLEPIRQMGKRNLDWLAYINQYRQQKISFTSAGTQNGIPIDSPRFYNPGTIVDDHQKLVVQLPEPLKRVVVDGEEFTKELPLSEEQYIYWGRKLDSSYQMANRWILLEPYLVQLELRRRGDVRGYYFLNKDPKRDEDLSNFARLTEERKRVLREWLTQMCGNSGRAFNLCRQDVSKAEPKGMLSFYQRYQAGSRALWNKYFAIPGVRNSHVLWRDANRTLVSFRDPESNERRNFIQRNIEDEWRFKDWRLEVALGADGIDVIFEPGVTPHVPGLGSSIIYMDANQPLSEYDAQWTIRHEFGHSLGLPDCYVEFYDADARGIVSYQLDIENLMCSRRGGIQEKHLSELKRVYQ